MEPLAIRTVLRRFLHWSDGQARTAGIVQRRSDPHDRRVVHLALTRKGNAARSRLSAQPAEEVARLADSFQTLWAWLEGRAGAGNASTTRGS